MSRRKQEQLHDSSEKQHLFAEVGVRTIIRNHSNQRKVIATKRSSTQTYDELPSGREKHEKGVARRLAPCGLVWSV